MSSKISDSKNRMSESSPTILQILSSIYESEKVFRSLIENSADAIALIDSTGRVLYASASTKRLLGYTPQEFVGTNGFLLVHKKDLPHVMKEMGLLLLKPGKSVSAEVRVKHKNGSYVWVESRGTNFLHDSNIRAIVVNFRDIHERKQTEEQLQAIMDGSPAIIYLKDIKGRYITINSQYEKLFHITKQQIKGRTDYDLFPTEVADTLRVNDKKVLKAGNPLEWEEVIPQDDGLHTYISSKFPLFDGNNKAYAICGISTDISERKELEKRKDDFISMASHELKTPVTSLKAYLQVIQKISEEKQDYKIVESLTKMDQQLNKLTKLIADLLDLSKIQAGKLEFLKESFFIDDLVREIVEILQPTTKKHRLIVTGQTRKKVLADRDRIGQVIINLISNAIKYSPHSDKVIIKTSSDKDWISVSVQDFGIGIDKKHQSKIFDRFYQVTDSMEKTFPGLGIGLFISSEIVKYHKGHIQVESKKKQGSTFSFSLPITKKKA